MSTLDIKQAIVGGAALFTASALAVLYLRKSRKEPGLETFPGPKPDFLIGNVRHFPRSHWSTVFGAWKEEYGT